MQPADFNLVVQRWFIQSSEERRKKNSVKSRVSTPSPYLHVQLTGEI